MSLRQIVESAPPIDCRQSCDDARLLFTGDAALHCLAVTDGDRPVGLLSRDRLLTLLAQRRGHDLYAGKSVQAVMDANPLIVDVDIAIDDLNRRIAQDKPAALQQGFIVVAGGTYLGTANGLRLLQATNAELEERAQQIDAQRRELQRIDEAKTHFLANVSHELRTPLNAIIGFSELISGEVFGEIGNERYIEYAHDIHSSGGHLLNIIDDLPDLARFEAGLWELKESAVDLSEIVSRSVRLLGARLRGAGLELEVNLPARLPPLLGDETKLRQVLINLLTNAVKFTPEGGNVSLHIEVADSGVEIAVCDTGVGIPDDKLEAVMQPFIQADNQPGDRPEGAGLGLPLSRSLVELHGGSLQLHSAEGHGTIVRVTLPPERLLGEAA